jgi:hypothetical protein
MTESFKIRRGRAAELFVDPTAPVLYREINKNLVIEVGCWYLTSDTAELFIGVLLDSGKKDLKRINGEDTLALIKEINDRLDAIEVLPSYQEIPDEYWLQGKLADGSLSSDITYYVVNKDALGNSLGTCSTYIVDTEAQIYYCTNSVDMSTIGNMVTSAIEIQLSEKFAEMLPQQVTKAIKEVFSGSIVLHGGTA